MGIMQRMRRLWATPLLGTMLAVGVVCLAVGVRCFQSVRPPHIAGEKLVDLHAVMVPSKDRCVADKVPYWVCPEAFVHGAQHDLSVGIERQVSHVDVVVEVPVSTRIKTMAWVSDRHSTHTSPTDVDADTRRLALTLLWDRARTDAARRHAPAPKGERSMFDEQDSTQVEWIPLGVAAVMLMPVGALLVLPPAFILPLRALRHSRTRRAAAAPAIG